MCDESGLEDWQKRILEIVQQTCKRRRLFEGVRIFLSTLARQEREFYEAIGKGATEVVLPPSVEKEAAIDFRCLCKLEAPTMDIFRDRILLNFEHTVWQCDKCGRVWAFRIEQPAEEEEVC